MSFHAAPVLNHPILAGSSERPLTVLVFFRGAWCPFCQGYLRELNQSFREKVEAAGGRLLAVTAQSAEVAARVQEEWALEYDVFSEPENLLAKHFGVAITPKAQSPLADHPSEYPHGMAQPAVVAFDGAGAPLYHWAIEPSTMNLGGASDRPLPDDIWAAISAAQAGEAPAAASEGRLNPDFLAAHYPSLHQTFLDWVAASSK